MYRKFQDWLNQFYRQDCMVGSEWTAFGDLTIYVRAGIRKRGSVELANMESRQRGGGNLKRFLDKYERYVPFYVENVLNPRLARHLVMRGYTVYFDPQSYTIPAALSPLFMSNLPQLRFPHCIVLTSSNILGEMADLLDYDNDIANSEVPKKPLAS